MWTSINHDSKREYYIRCESSSNNEYMFYITNLIHLWEKHFTTSDLLLLIQESNPLLEGDTDGLIQQCLDILFTSLSQSICETHITFDGETRENISLNVKAPKGSFPFKINLKCKMTTSLKFYEQVTLSLITMIKELKDSESHLIECIKKKDAEIQDYRAEGTCLSLKHLETKVFNEHEHQLMYTPSNILYFDCNNLPVGNSDVQGNLTPKHPIHHSVASSVKKESSKKHEVESSASSPSLQFGIAPVFTNNEEELKEVCEEHLARLRKRKRTVRKQLNL